MSGRGKTKKADKKVQDIAPISFKGRRKFLIAPENVSSAFSLADAPSTNDPTKRASRIAQTRTITLPNSSAIAGHSGSALAEIELTPLAYSIFGEKYVKELLNNGIINTVRDIWELSTPTTQCGNIIGPPTNATTCWICSLPLSNVEGLTPECEHILPIAQAVLYLGLFSVSAEKKMFPAEMFVLPGVSGEILRYEYRWAHRICNQVKNDDSYLDFNLSKQEYFVRKDKIADLLNRIKTNSRVYGASIKPLLRAKATFDKAISNAITIYEALCNFLNSYKAPRLLELAGIISAGYGPRKVSVNPKWEHNVRVISQEELEGNMRKEIIKANIEYEGIYKKTLSLVGKLTDIDVAVSEALNKIIENRRPEYVSLLMRITPSPKNMKYAIAYIRSQLFGELATIDAKTLGLQDSERRRTANQRFRELLTTIGAFTPVETDTKFNAELVKANRLYQEDSSIGDTIRTTIGKYTEESTIAPDILQAELRQELTESGGESDPIDPASEYAEIISHTTAIISSMNPTSMTASVAPSYSVASDPWIDGEANAIISREELKWDVLLPDDKKVVESATIGLLSMKHSNAEAIAKALSNMRGGNKTRRRRHHV